MAKYTVKFSCGHEEVVELYGSHAERERKIAYYEQHGKCKECYKAEKLAAEKAAAKEIENLPELEGSEKQIAWAKSICQGWVNEVVAFIENGTKSTVEAFVAKFNALTEEQKKVVTAKSEMIAKYAVLVSETSAKYYIGNR